MFMENKSGLLIIGTLVFSVLLKDTMAETGMEEFENEEIVPDIIDTVPQSILNVTYENNVKVDLGNILTPTQVQNVPNTTWDADPKKFYTLTMTDLDVPSRKGPKNREAQHYIVGNIPGSEISEGEVLAEYFGSGPKPETGLHRYVFLVYEQPGMLTFEEKRLKKNVDPLRVGFSSRKFVEKYGLGEPIAGNFFQAEWDDYVPKLYAELIKNTKN